MRTSTVSTGRGKEGHSNRRPRRQQSARQRNFSQEFKAFRNWYLATNCILTRFSGNGNPDKKFSDPKGGLKRLTFRVNAELSRPTEWRPASGNNKADVSSLAQVVSMSS